VGHMGDLDRKVKQYAFELQHQAFHDPLTGLPNRALFSDRLEHATARTMRGGSSVAVLFLDLDGFKRINDLHGHAVGDLLLKAASGRIQDTVRAGDTVARLGGDEFVVLLEDLVELDVAQQVAHRLTSNLARPFIMSDMVYTISVSIGISFCPTGESLSGDLLREADRAMYQAKATGTGRYEVFQPMVA
ncbi:MAG: GGDEF domain-containing protein, partial [Nitrolancea sp.]